MAHDTVIREYFYTVQMTPKGDFRTVEHFETKNEAVKWARESSGGGMIVEVRSSVENNGVETWFNRKHRFVKYNDAFDYAQDPQHRGH